MYTAAPIPPASAGPNPGGSTPYLWSAVAVVAGLAGVASALLAQGPAGAAVAGIGVATGIVGLLRARAADAHPLAAVLGLVVSALAVVVSVVMTVAPALMTKTEAPAAAAPAEPIDPKEMLGNTDVEDVLTNELNVEFGTVSVDPWGRVNLPVTLTNKLDKAKSFYVTVGAFDSGGTQIATDEGAGALLGPHAIQETTAFSTVSDQPTVEKMKTATFKVVAVKSRMFSM